MKKSPNMRKSFALGIVAIFVFALGAMVSERIAGEESPNVVERIRYESTMQDYRDLLKQLRTLKDEYQTATPQQRDTIAAQYRPLVAETEKVQQQLIPSAIAAFNETDGDDPELTPFLLGMLEWMIINKENYETAYAIAKALIPFDKIPEPLSYLYAYAAFAAFNVMELDDAQAWYKIAKERKGLEQLRQYDTKNKMNIPMTLEQVLPTYRPVWEKERAIREKEAAADNLPRVLIKTTQGEITIELFANEAPEAVGNFLTLVSKKYYDGTPFHRVLPYFMAQGGDPTGTGTGGPGYSIQCECYRPDARMHFRGSLSMAHAGRNTGGSQFFLTFVPTSFLNGKHTVFGRVIEGMNVLSEIQRIDPEGENLPAPDKIVEARILRGEPTPFEKLPSRR